jgi:hypothetical protein
METRASAARLRLKRLCPRLLQPAARSRTPPPSSRRTFWRNEFVDWVSSRTS